MACEAFLRCFAFQSTTPAKCLHVRLDTRAQIFAQAVHVEILADFRSL